MGEILWFDLQNNNLVVMEEFLQSLEDLDYTVQFEKILQFLQKTEDFEEKFANFCKIAQSKKVFDPNLNHQAMFNCFVGAGFGVEFVKKLRSEFYQENGKWVDFLRSGRLKKEENEEIFAEIVRNLSPDDVFKLHGDEKEKALLVPNSEVLAVSGGGFVAIGGGRE